MYVYMPICLCLFVCTLFSRNLLLFFTRDAAAILAVDVVDLYNGETGFWSTATLSVPRYSPTAASVGNMALFAGGATNEGRES
jgi:hypothetical protein